MTRLLPCAVRAFVACVALCATPVPAFAQSEIPVPTTPPGPLPHERVHLLTAAVQALATSQVLTPGHAEALARGLDKAGEALRRGEARTAMRRLDTFSRHVSGLAAAGTMNGPTARRLLEEASQARGQVAELAFGAGAARPASWSFEGCAERRPCVYAVVFVNPRAAVLGARDGTEMRPYRTIADALGHGEDQSACGIEIRLADGLYWEDVALSRHTTIDGESRLGTVLIGSIVNNAGVDLTVRDLSVAAVRGPGGVFADAPCAWTRLTNVLIDSSARFGLYQRGGVLTVSSSVIRNTVADESSRFAGTAVFLTGGVRPCSVSWASRATRPAVSWRAAARPGSTRRRSR
jgi:hypothetical protein